MICRRALNNVYSEWEYFILDGLLNVGITIMVCRRALNNVDALAAEGVLVIDNRCR